MNQKMEVGSIGENIVHKCLIIKNYKVLGRNIRYKCGEIDIIAEKDGIVHFIEVKTLYFDYDYKDAVFYDISPESNMTRYKTHKLLKAIEMYLMSYSDQNKINWQIDVVAVYLYKKGKCKIEFYPNIIL